MNANSCYVDVEKKIEVYTKREFKYLNFQKIILKCDISFNKTEKRMKIGGLVVGSHTGGTLSQICHLGPSFYFMESRN